MGTQISVPAEVDRPYLLVLLAGEDEFVEEMLITREDVLVDPRVAGLDVEGQRLEALV